MLFRYLCDLLKPKNATDAATIRSRLAVAYAFFGWNSVICFFYMKYKENLPSDPDERRMAMINKGRGQTYDLVRIDGLTILKTSTRDNTPPNSQDKENIITT